MCGNEIAMLLYPACIGAMTFLGYLTYKKYTEKKTYAEPTTA